jgi:transmembrane sensor
MAPDRRRPDRHCGRGRVDRDDDARAARLAPGDRYRRRHGGDPAGTVYGDASGAQQQINLADGSVIRLDARSRVRVNFTGQSREVTMLEGRAYFTVQHGPRPFVVRSPGGETIDLGTRFVIELGGGLTRVSLVEGKIAIRPAGSARELPLEPGEVSGYTDKGTILAKAPARNDPIDWTSGRLKFEDTPLVEAVARLSRYSDKPILLAPDVAASNRRVTGVFFIGDSENFAATLASALDLKVISDEDGRQHLIQP